MHTIYVGLDVGAAETAVCVIDEDGGLLGEETVESTASAALSVVQRVAPDAIAAFALEAGAYDHLTRQLRQSGAEVVVFEARQAHRFLEIRRNKTDTNDARGLADLLRLGRSIVSHVYQRSDECQRLRVQLKLRATFIHQRMVAENALRSAVGQWGIRLLPIYSEDGARSACEAALALLPLTAAEAVKEDLEQFVSLACDLRQTIRKMDLRLKRMARANDVCSRLMTVPGVGYVTALSFYSVIDDPARFKRIVDVAAYLGLTPRIAQSGATWRGGRISKMGNTLTRSHLYSAAQVLLTVKKDSALKDWATALRKRIGLPKARIATARKMAVILMSIWRSGETFEPYPAKRIS